MKLGRGLDALLGEMDEAYGNEGSSQDSIIELPLKDIRPNPYQPRKYFDENSLLELGESIKNDGLLQPIVVTEDIDGYILIAGERRLRASKLVRKSINPKLSIKGFVPTMFSSQNNLSKQVFADLKQHFNGKLFKDEKDKYIVVPRNVKLAEAPSFGKPAILYDVKSVGAMAYQNLAQSIIA